MENYYTIKEAAEILGCDKRTLIRALARGQLDYIKIGRQYRIPKKEIALFLE